jgi:hypothetical protein
MTAWENIDPDADDWWALFRGEFDSLQEFSERDMIAAWTDEASARNDLGRYQDWERRGGREIPLTLVRYSVTDQFQIRSKTISSSRTSLKLLDYHKPWWDFEIARRELTVSQCSVER